MSIYFQNKGLYAIYTLRVTRSTNMTIYSSYSYLLSNFTRSHIVRVAMQLISQYCGTSNNINNLLKIWKNKQFEPNLNVVLTEQNMRNICSLTFYVITCTELRMYYLQIKSTSALHQFEAVRICLLCHLALSLLSFPLYQTY